MIEPPTGMSTMSIVISLTTIPSRINLIEATINSLLLQDTPVYLWIPHYTAKTDTHYTLNQLPSWLTNRKNLTVTLVDDLGSITKLIPALEQTEADTIITVDDDCIYPPHFVETLTQGMAAYHYKKALCFRGKVLFTPYYRQAFSFRNVKKPRVVDIVTGVYGVAYQRAWFDIEILTHLSKDFPGNDDIVISAYLDNCNIERLTIPFAKGETVIENEGTKKVDSLWWSGNKNHRSKNDEAIKAFGLGKFSKNFIGRLLLWKNPFLRPTPIKSEVIHG